MIIGEKFFDIDEIPINVSISSSVLDRIIAAVRDSNVEEGGKFVGKINWTMEGINVNLLSYVDTGPRECQSATHILPDSEYQRYAFSLLELHDEDIKHLGFWQSHHCNEPRELSSDDINRYTQNINSDRNPHEHKINLYFAVSVTDINNNQLSLMYYLFKCGWHELTEIDQSIISYNYTSEPLNTDILDKWKNWGEEVVEIGSDGRIYKTNYLLQLFTKLI